jgi:hypothetical protein
VSTSAFIHQWLICITFYFIGVILGRGKDLAAEFTPSSGMRAFRFNSKINDCSYINLDCFTIEFILTSTQLHPLILLFFIVLWYRPYLLQIRFRISRFKLPIYSLHKVPEFLQTTLHREFYLQANIYMSCNEMDIVRQPMSMPMKHTRCGRLNNLYFKDLFNDHFICFSAPWNQTLYHLWCTNTSRF